MNLLLMNSELVVSCNSIFFKALQLFSAVSTRLSLAVKSHLVEPATVDLFATVGDVCFAFFSDPYWWKGQGSNGVGLFPANFVTNDLTAPVESETENQVVDEQKEEREPVVKFSDEPQVKEVDQSQPVLEINPVIDCILYCQSKMCSVGE